MQHADANQRWVGFKIIWSGGVETWYRVGHISIAGRMTVDASLIDKNKIANTDANPMVL